MDEPFDSGPKQFGLDLGETTPPQSFEPDPNEIRQELHEILEEARNRRFAMGRTDVQLSQGGVSADGELAARRGTRPVTVRVCAANRADRVFDGGVTPTSCSRGRIGGN
jgi:hypothetical protein